MFIQEEGWSKSFCYYSSFQLLNMTIIYDPQKMTQKFLVSSIILTVFQFYSFNYVSTLFC